MSDNRNDFDFDDDFFQDDNDQFDFGGDEDELPAGLGEDAFDEDMPVLEEEPEERGGSRAFIVLAVLMILLFLGGLALVLFLILRPTGPSDLELTATQVVLLNQTVEAQLAQTQTQARDFEIMTLTAAAFTETPSPTPTETPVTREPTRTPTATLDPTDLAATQLAISFAQTATALAQPTVTPTFTAAPVSLRESFATEVAFATAQGVFQADVFATQVVLATQIAGGVVSTQPAAVLELGATQISLSTQVAQVSTSVAVVDAGIATVAAQNSALAEQFAQATSAAVETQNLLATQVAQAGNIAAGTPAANPEQESVVTQVAQATQAALDARATLVQDAVASQVPAIGENFATEVALATSQGEFQQGAVSTLAAVGTEIAAAPTSAQPGAPDIAQIATSIAATQAALGQQLSNVSSAIDAVNAGFATLAVANLPIATELSAATPANAATQSALVTPQILATQAAIETQAFLATQLADAADVSGPANDATQAAFSTPPFFSTQAAVATQVALATRAVLVEIASGGAVVLAPTTVPTSALEAVNQTATAIAGAFLTATAQAGGIQPTTEPGVTVTAAPVTPGFTPVATALPDTGLFDTLGTGGSDSLGLLALAVVGLVGLIFVSRRVRSMNNKPAPPENPPEG